MTQAIGTCAHCGSRAPLFGVPSGELYEPHLCERCARKQASRDADEAALASGEMTREELARKNVFLSAERFDIDLDSAVPLK